MKQQQLKCKMPVECTRLSWHFTTHDHDSRVNSWIQHFPWNTSANTQLKKVKAFYAFSYKLLRKICIVMSKSGGYWWWCHIHVIVVSFNISTSLLHFENHTSGVSLWRLPRWIKGSFLQADLQNMSCLHHVKNILLQVIAFLFFWFLILTDF